MPILFDMIKHCFAILSIFAFIGNNLAQNVNVTFVVDASDINVSAEGISIGGSFQNWDPPTGGMTDLGNGLFQRTYSIAANSQIQFKFINGNTWGGTIESVPPACGISDGFGGYNRVYSVGANDVTYGPVCFSSCEPCVQEVLVPVTFQVDMSNEVVSPQGVHVAGSFQDWNPSANQLQDIGNGLYELTLDVPANTTHYFKFLNGNTWDGQETVPSLCGISDGFGAFNRFFQTDTEASSFGPVCFESCYECGEALPVLINFSVDMSDQEISPEGIFMTGSFNDFNPTDLQMFNAGNGIYEVSLVLNQGEYITYKFLNGPGFDFEETVPEDCGVSNGLGGFNRSYTCGNNPETVSTVCFSQCLACASETEFSITLQVNMSEQIVNPEGVFVAGNFNNFSPTANQLIDLGDGLYSVTVSGPANEVMVYKFLNGPDYAFEEIVPSDCGIDNGVGGYDRAIYLDADTTLAPVCFGTCELCIPENVIENRSSSLVMYPNPSGGVFYVAGVEYHYFQAIRIYNLRGELIKTVTIQNGFIDLSDCASGMYYAIDGKNRSHKLLVR